MKLIFLVFLVFSCLAFAAEARRVIFYRKEVGVNGAQIFVAPDKIKCADDTMLDNHGRCRKVNIFKIVWITIVALLLIASVTDARPRRHRKKYNVWSDKVCGNNMRPDGFGGCKPLMRNHRMLN
ncbi:hypothetical protein DMENIID0001_038490 [Sergentomyia squamirostris]